MQFYFVFLNNGFVIYLDSRNLILVRAYQGGFWCKGCDRAWRVEGIMELEKNAGSPIFDNENAVKKSDIHFLKFGRS